MMQIYNLRYTEAEPERSHESRGWKPAGQQETEIQKQEDLKLVPSLQLCNPWHCKRNPFYLGNFYLKRWPVVDAHN